MRSVRAVTNADRPQLAGVITDNWGSTRMATRGRLVDISTVDGFIAKDASDWLGYAGYEIHGDAMEVVSLQALTMGQGVASALLAACVSVARGRGLRRVWLITTNDNIDALRFYQRRGFVLVAVHRDAITAARESLKPEIGLVGDHDIPIRDEIELELPRANWHEFVERHVWPS